MAWKLADGDWRLGVFVDAAASDAHADLGAVFSGTPRAARASRGRILVGRMT